MKTLKARLISAVGAAVLCFSVSSTALASWDTPNQGDAFYAVDNITVEVQKILACTSLKTGDIKVISLEEILSGDRLINIRDTLKKFTVTLELITLKNSLNNLNVLNGNDIISVGDVLSDNNVVMDDVVGVVLFPRGKLLILTD